MAASSGLKERIAELEALVSAKEAIIAVARQQVVDDANDHNEAISWHERRYENVIQTLNSAKSTIIELRDALKDAALSGEITLDLIAHGSKQFFLLQVEHEKLTRKNAELKVTIRRNDDDDF